PPVRPPGGPRRAGVSARAGSPRPAWSLLRRFRQPAHRAAPPDRPRRPPGRARDRVSPARPQGITSTLPLADQPATTPVSQPPGTPVSCTAMLTVVPAANRPSATVPIWVLSIGPIVPSSAPLANTSILPEAQLSGPSWRWTVTLLAQPRTLMTVRARRSQVWLVPLHCGENAGTA